MPLAFSPGSLRRFDAFAKPLKDFRIQTVSGAFLSITCITIIFILFVWEFADYLSPAVKQEIIVDISRNRQMSINFDITFHYVPCHALSVDSMDISGEQRSAITQDVNKTSILADGKSDNENAAMLKLKRNESYCGSCYGAGKDDKQCCNTCEAVVEAYRIRGWSVKDPLAFEQCKDEKSAGSLGAIGQEGCRVVGKLGVNKVAGSFHIAPGKSFGEGNVHVHDLIAFSGKQFKLDHHIHYLSFGDTYPGQINPLDNSNMSEPLESPMISYFLKLVPTIYSDLLDTPLVTNQYSATWQIKSTPLTGGSDGIPGVFFNYQISPLLVKLTRERRSFLHFLTNTCAIVGGVYTVTSLLDAFVYRSSCILAKMK
nr:endoplasmic reticulum Golgi intermediate [Hymenolepis microstoma]